MANVLYMAISRDGLIAGPHDETPWSDEEWEAFQVFVQTCDIILLGKRTYQIMQEHGEFVNGPHYIVATTDQNLNTHGFEKRTIYSATDMPRAGKIGIIGGGELNGRLAELGLINEIILDTEAVDLHAGIPLFGKHKISPKLQLLSSRQLGPQTVQRHYKVLGWD